MRNRAPFAAALAAVLSLAPVAALPALASSRASSSASARADAVAAAPKVVIVVGAVEGQTASFRADADDIYDEAIQWTPNVIRLYSPNATWEQVKAAAQGASIFVYLGHGYGFPSPYRTVLSPTVHDGMGLNLIGGVDDNDKKYYGESLIASQIRFAKDAIVLLNHLCYSAGSSESGHPEPTVSVARQRVDNFASGFIKAGARTVIAQSWTSGVIYTIRSIFTSDQSILDVWKNAPNKRGHELPFVPVRNPQFEGRLDPDTWTTGYHRSIVSSPGHRTSQIVAGADVPPTNPAPDDAAPQLWSVDGPTTLTPNFDGVADKLALLARFSETVGWTATLRNGGGDVVRTLAGNGHQAAIGWDLKVGGAAAPAGDYTWELHATDAAGNPPLDESGTFTVADAATPASGVLSFEPTTPLTTTASSISYALQFAGPVTGLQISDFTRTGTAESCVVGAPAGSGAAWTITVTGCTTGSVGLYLNAGQVLDASLVAGPAGPAVAPNVTIDRTAPKVTTPKAALRTGVQLGGASTAQPLLASVTWTGSDGGSGVANYDVWRSVDGGTWTSIAARTTATSVDVSLTPGHSYKFKVRARDKAGNVGAWSPVWTWYAALVQQSATGHTWAGSWATGAAADHSGGSAKSSRSGGSSVTYKFSGRAIAWVTTLRPESGEVQVWVDGALAATIDTHADAVTYRHVAFSRSWSGYAAHTIKLVVLGTAGHPRGDLDAFEVIR